VTRYQEPGTERTVDVDETSGELLLALGWTLAQPAPADALAASLASEGEGSAPFQPVDAFDPGAHTAQEVLAYLADAEPAEVARVLIAEVDGKHRSTVLAFNPGIPTADTDADDLLGEAE
jgi:hypothetical protein